MKIGLNHKKNGRYEFTVWAPFSSTVSLKIVSPKEKIIPMEKDSGDIGELPLKIRFRISCIIIDSMTRRTDLTRYLTISQKACTVPPKQSITLLTGKMSIGRESTSLKWSFMKFT